MSSYPEIKKSNELCACLKFVMELDHEISTITQPPLNNKHLDVDNSMAFFLIKQYL